MQQITNVEKVSMRHLYLYTYLLLDEAKRAGRKVRLVWSSISTASIGPDPTTPNGLVLQLPQMATTGTQEDAELLQALISHEILCHGHHTDFDVIPDPGIGGALENVMEDPRGELLALKSFPGSKKVIRRGVEILVDRGIFTGPTEEEIQGGHPAKILTSWLVTELRSELLGQDCLKDFARDYRKLAIKTFGTSLTAAVKSVALKAAAAKSTGEVQLHARQILSLLKLAQESPPPPSGGEDGDQNPEEGDGTDQGQGSGGEGDQGQGDQPGQDGGEAGSGEGGQGQGDKPGQDGGQAGAGKGDARGDQPGQDGKGGPDKGNSNIPTPGKGFEPDPKALAKAIQAVIDASAEDAGAYAAGLEQNLVEASEAMGGGGMSHSHEMGQAPAPVYNSPTSRSQLRQDAKATTATLALRLQELLEARNMVRRRRSEEGHLQANRLVRAALGDMNIFQKRSRVEELNTAVMVLTDESSSMDLLFDFKTVMVPSKVPGEPPAPAKVRVPRSEAATKVAVAVGEVLSDAEVPFSLAGFHTSLREYHPFDGDWAKTLTNYRELATGSTNTHLAVVWALRRLIERREDRKILIVVLDGDPGKIDVLQAALNEAASYGVEIRFVLIGDQLEKHYLELNAPYGLACNTSQLAGAVFGALEAAFA